jgi:threonine dehydratase
MPSNAPAVKKEAVLGYGGQVIECEPTLAAREAAAAALVARTGASLVHPYDDPWVIAGQGTATLEYADQAARPEVLLVPVGGGGLLSGSALAARTLWPGTRVVGVEPLGADDAARGFRAGRRQSAGTPVTIADGLRGELSERTFGLIRAHVDDIVTVREDSIRAAMLLVWRFLKVVIEPSAAVPVAALLEGRVTDASAGIVLSGGNVDFAALGELLAPRPG